MRAVSGPRVIVVGAGVYGLAAARRLALEGADVSVFEAREAGGPSRPRPAPRACCASSTAPTRTTRSSSCVRGSSGGSSSACSARRCTRRPACSGSRSRSRATSGTPWRRAWPPAFRCACSSPPRPCGSSRHSRPKASRSCCTTRRAACCTRAARRSAWRGWRAPRERPARGRRGARDRRRNRGARRRQRASGPTRCSWPPARGPRGLLAAPIRSTQQVNVYLRVRDGRTCRSGSTTSTSTASATTAARASRSAGMPSAPTWIPTIRRRARRRRRRCSGSPTPRAGAYRACPGPPASTPCAAPTSAATR